MSTPSITAVVAAYNAAEWIGETLSAILGQTRAPDEVVVVDDGSTDETASELASFGGRIRVVTRANGGCPAAFNTGFAEAHSDYVAICGADDIWEPAKLERQLSTLTAHPRVDVAFSAARIFGTVTDHFQAPRDTGLLDSGEFLRALYRRNIICASSVLIRRALYLDLGPFVERCADERFACDDYDYWIRALAAGAVFFYEPHVNVNYRRHIANATNNQLWMYRSQTEMHRWHAGKVDDDRLVRTVLARDLFMIARAHIDAGERRRARVTFAQSLRLRIMPRALVFVLVLSLPERHARRAVAMLVELKHAIVRATTRSLGRGRWMSRGGLAHGEDRAAWADYGTD